MFQVLLAHFYEIHPMEMLRIPMAPAGTMDTRFCILVTLDIDYLVIIHERALGQENRGSGLVVGHHVLVTSHSPALIEA